MTQWHLKSGTKPSGGARHSVMRCDKKKVWKGRDPANTRVIKGEKEKRTREEGRGHTSKIKLKEAIYAQLIEGKKSEKMKLTNVLENGANRQFARALIVTKGAILEGTVGERKVLARVTNRPGQTGNIQAVAISDEEKQERKDKTEAKKKKAKDKPKKIIKQPKAKKAKEAEEQQ